VIEAQEKLKVAALQAILILEVTSGSERAGGVGAVSTVP
jgi:hypothetical protein